MACYHPIPAWLAKRRNESGKRSVVFNVNDGFKDRPLEVPCGNCVGCRLERSRQWAVRCVHESKLWPMNCFVTLTYETPPANGSLRPRDFVLFMKRLRLVKPGVRFFQCGEYGERLERPHHHALLFNCWFDDMRFLKEKTPGNKLYTSAELDMLWSHGQCTLGALTFESAAYCARYCMKKVLGNPVEYYGKRLPEYATMSRRPGIGAGFFDKFRTDVFPRDEVIVRGVRCKPPRYYDNLLERKNARMLYNVKVRRKVAKSESISKVGGEVENSKKLKREEIVKTAAISHLTREVER